MSTYAAALPKFFPWLAVAPRHVLALGLDRLLNWRQRQKIIRELSEYTPRELSELGISPADIEIVAASVEPQ